jgi:hypothetical protein
MFDQLESEANRLYRESDVNSPLVNAEQLMRLDGLMMHCPEHHYIVPAALLLAAHSACGSDAQRVEHDLALAKTRAMSVPGGFCGNCGCCGAAVGAGIFLSVWFRVHPKSSENWSLVNRLTAACLNRVATVEGPRCCKRVTYLALMEAVAFCTQETDLQLEAPQEAVCSWFPGNKECRTTACPFFPGKHGAR